MKTTYIPAFSRRVLLALLLTGLPAALGAQTFFGQDSLRLRLFDEALFYDVYNGNVFDAGKQDGILRLSNSRYAVPLQADALDQLGDTLRLDVTIGAACDNYDRIGYVGLVLLPKGATGYEDHGIEGGYNREVTRIEVARFITPFMNKNLQPDHVPYHFDISFLSPMLHDLALRDTVDLWVELNVEGVPYAANTQVAGCSGRSDVFYATLDIVSSPTPALSNRTSVVVPLSYHRYLNNYQGGATDEAGTTVAHYSVHVDEPLTDALFLLITSNHGANAGGEEYNRRLHYVYVNDWMASVYRPGRTSCEPFRQYNTQGNGIYGSRAMTDEEWQSFSNWCPGDKIDQRIVRLGAVPAGDYDLRLLVPDAVFADRQGYFPLSLSFHGLREGAFSDVDALTADAPHTIRVSWDGSVLRLSDGTRVRDWTLFNAAGQRLMVQPGPVYQVEMHHRPSGVYVLHLLLDDGTTETFKIFKP